MKLKYQSLLYVLLVLGLITIGLLNHDLARATAQGTIDRFPEPIGVSGLFRGAPVDELFVYHYKDGEWQQIPFQIDEKTFNGTYISVEDNIMDANDEIVFMSTDLGELATEEINQSLPVEGLWYQIAVTDPLHADAQGWVYVIRSQSLTYTNPTDYASYDSTTKRIETDNYAIGWAATGHNGLDYMRVAESDDILDRTKLRVRYRLMGPKSLTEDDLPVRDLNLIKDGPVRVITTRGTVITFASASMYQTLTPIDLTSIPVVIDEVRLSTDLASGVQGTYYNENLPNGVPIDGSTDTVTSTPFENAWRQVDLQSGGSMIQIVLNLAQEAIGGQFSHYYKDNATEDNADTGDRESHGDSGFMVFSPTAKEFTFNMVQYILPTSQGNRGAEFFEMSQNPLNVTVSLQPASNNVYIPQVAK